MIEFQIDTGSDVAVISEGKLHQTEIWRKLVVNKTHRRFRSHPGNLIVPLGVVEVNVRYGSTARKLELFILPGEGPPLLGRTWIHALSVPLSKLMEECINPRIDLIQNDSQRDIDQILEEFGSVFSSKLGKYKKGKFQLHLKEEATPEFCRPRPLPYAMREKVECELNRLVKEDILEPVNNSDWGTPIGPIFKSNGQLRLCGDYKVTLNPHIKVDRYPIPRVQDLLATLNGGTVF